MKHHYFIIRCALITMLTPLSVCALPSLKNVKSLFKKQTPETIIQKEFVIKPNSVTSIENIHGNIYIKTEWNQNSIILSATQKSSPNEDDSIEIVQEQTDSGDLCIKTNATQKKTKASMDLTVIVPTNSVLNLTTKNGVIADSGELNGTITATTSNGFINLHGSHANIEATALEKGTISVSNATKDVIAQSNKGSIDICCDELNSHHKIWAKSKKGTVTIDLPEKVDARLYARSERGTVRSDKPVTLASRTTELNNKAWKNFKQEVDGIIGIGKNAEIKVIAGSSIKINNITA